jgi:hypothetical protein
LKLGLKPQPIPKLRPVELRHKKDRLPASFCSARAHQAAEDAGVKPCCLGIFGDAALVRPLAATHKSCKAATIWPRGKVAASPETDGGRSSEKAELEPARATNKPKASAQSDRSGPHERGDSCGGPHAQRTPGEEPQAKPERHTES